jgi:O-antigen ligase
MSGRAMPEGRLPDAQPIRGRLERPARAFDGIQTFGLALLLFGLPVGEFLKSLGLAIAVFGFAGGLACGRLPSFGRRPALIALGAYFGIAALSVAVARPGFRRPVELFAMAMVLIVFPIVLDACQRRSRVVLFVWAILTGAALAAVMGYAKFTVGDARPRLGLPSIENAVTAGEYLAAAVTVGVAMLWFEWRARIAGPFLWLAVGATTAALFLTKSRGAFLGAAAGLATLVAYLFGKRYALILLVVVVAGAWIFVATHPDARFVTARYQIDARLLAWRGAVEKLQERPLLGHGPGTFEQFGIVYRDEQEVNPQVHAHNQLLQAAAETGVLGAGALVLFLVLGMRDVVRSARTTRHRLWRSVAYGALAGAVALVVAGLTSLTMTGESGMLLVALLAIGAAGGGEGSA